MTSNFRSRHGSCVNQITNLSLLHNMWVFVVSEGVCNGPEKPVKSGILLWYESRVHITLIALQ